MSSRRFRSAVLRESIKRQLRGNIQRSTVKYCQFQLIVIDVKLHGISTLTTCRYLTYGMFNENVKIKFHFMF